MSLADVMKMFGSIWHAMLAVDTGPAIAAMVAAMIIGWVTVGWIRGR